MKHQQQKSAKPQFQNNQLWESLDNTQSQAISGGGPLLFANPFAYATDPKTPSLAGRLGIGS